MKPWKLAAICLLVGLVIGGLASFLVVRRHAARMFEFQYEIQCRDQVNVLNQIRSGNADKLLEVGEERLPQWAANVPSVVRDKQTVHRILWAVQRYYEQNAVTVPENLRPVLDSLPPRPLTACEIKQEDGK